MVWLKPCRQDIFCPNRCIAGCCNMHLASCKNQIHVSHDLGDCCNCFACQSPAGSHDLITVCCVIQNPFSHLLNGFSLDFTVDFFIYVILDDSGNRILFIRNCRIFSQITHRKLSKNLFCCNPLQFTFCRYSRQFVPGFFFACFCQNIFDVFEFIYLP